MSTTFLKSVYTVEGLPKKNNLFLRFLLISLCFNILMPADNDAPFGDVLLHHVTNDKLHIRFPVSFNRYSIEIIDVSGRIVKFVSNYFESIDISNINKGVYYVNIKDEFNQSVYIEKLIVL